MADSWDRTPLMWAAECGMRDFEAAPEPERGQPQLERRFLA